MRWNSTRLNHLLSTIRGLPYYSLPAITGRSSTEQIKRRLVHSRTRCGFPRRARSTLDCRLQGYTLQFQERVRSRPFRKASCVFQVLANRQYFQIKRCTSFKAQTRDPISTENLLQGIICTLIRIWCMLLRPWEVSSLLNRRQECDHILIPSWMIR